VDGVGVGLIVGADPAAEVVVLAAIAGLPGSAWGLESAPLSAVLAAPPPLAPAEAVSWATLAARLVSLPLVGAPTASVVPAAAVAGAVAVVVTTLVVLALLLGGEDDEAAAAVPLVAVLALVGVAVPPLAVVAELVAPPASPASSIR